MKNFSELLDALLLSPSRNEKIDHLARYFASTSMPERGYGLAAITGSLDFPNAKTGVLKKEILKHVDEELFRLSYDFVGDLAETIAHLWPSPLNITQESLPLSAIIERIHNTSRNATPEVLSQILDTLPDNQRYAFLKLITGGLRVGVSTRLCKIALAQWSGKDVNEIEEIWHGLTPPYESLFSWLEGHTARPQSNIKAPFRPVMLSTALAEQDYGTINPSAFVAEWKWDGIRIQAVSHEGQKRIYTRTGEDISHAFPDIVDHLDFEGTIDGELLVMDKEGSEQFSVADFNTLQQRLNRKTVSKKILEDYPAFIRAYDILFDGAQDLRALPFEDRRKRLETLIAQSNAQRVDISPLLSFSSFEALAALRAAPPDKSIEGLMLKDKSSAYLIGRKKGGWYKWKKDPFKIDALLMYAQRGHGKRSGLFSDFTFGVWREAENGALELVPVGKAYFGFTDEELRKIDKFVRENTIDRFGPVRSVHASIDKGLVLEIAFEGISYSKRHKSGVAMRFPRVSRLRWDKPPSDINHLQDLNQLIDSV